MIELRELCDLVADLQAQGQSRDTIVEVAAEQGWGTRQDVFGAYWLLNGGYELEDTDALLDRDVQLTDTKAKLQRLKRENKTLKLRAAKVDRLVEAYSQARPPQAPVPLREIKAAGTRQVLITVSGDEHISAFLSWERLHGLNQYDMEIARQRMLYVAERAAAFVMRYWRDKSIRRIVDVNLGDKFQGVIHDAEATNEAEQADAVMHWVETKAACYNYILRQCPHVTIKSVHLTGNHTRRSVRQDVNRPKNHDDYLSARFLQTLFRDEPRVEFDIPDSYWRTLNINGHAFICTHGQFVRSYMGIPFYGILRHYKEMALISEKTDEHQAMLISAVKALIDEHGDELTLDKYRPIQRHWIQGHFHTCCRGIDTSMGTIFMNGSLIGPEDYGLSIAAATPPRQLFISVHPKQITDVIAIDLQHICHPRSIVPAEVLEPITVMA